MQKIKEHFDNITKEEFSKNLEKCGIKEVIEYVKKENINNNYYQDIEVYEFISAYHFNEEYRFCIDDKGGTRCQVETQETLIQALAS